MAEPLSLPADWSLREAILDITHRWYLVLAFCLGGALLGWLFGWLWPAPYRASRELYVGLNVYHAARDRNAVLHSGVEFINANDYKNWQMDSLNSIVYMDAILDETLARLQALNPYWVTVEREELAAMLHVYWRNAGKWRLVAEAQSSDRAVEAVLVWQDVLVEHVHEAVAYANTALTLDVQLQALAEQRSALQAQTAGLQAGADVRTRLDGLDREYARLSAEFAAASQKSLGLSAELLVQKLSRTRVYLDPVRPFGVLMLVGAVVGLCAWGLWWLLEISRRRPVPPAGASAGQEPRP